MSLPRFFLENQVLSAEGDDVFALRLTAGDARHARALRLQPGEHIAVVDAAQDYFECEVVSMRDDVEVRISRHEADAGPGPQVILLQGLCKGDKMDTVIRHATELGVSAFVPLVCERSVVRLDAGKAASRVQRWRSVAKSAAMQSGQPAIPQVSEPMRPREAAQMLTGATCVAVCWEEARSTSLRQAVQSGLEAANTPAADARVAICVGPEGGFSEAEVQALCSTNARSYPVTLGRSILRTETAGIVAPALAIHELGGLQ